MARGLPWRHPGRRWPLVVLALLAGSLGTAGAVAWIAGPDGFMPFQPPVLALPWSAPAHPAAPVFPDFSDPVTYCRTYLEPGAPSALAIGDATRSLAVTRHTVREAGLSPENALLFKALGFRPATGLGLEAVMDVNETTRATCTLRQQVNLTREDTLAYLALNGVRLPVDYRGLAWVTLTATVQRSLVQTVALHPDDVKAVLALAGGTLAPEDLLRVARVERREVESSDLSQAFELPAENVLAGSALKPPAGFTPGESVTRVA